MASKKCYRDQALIDLLCTTQGKRKFADFLCDVERKEKLCNVQEKPLTSEDLKRIVLLAGMKDRRLATKLIHKESDLHDLVQASLEGQVEPSERMPEPNKDMTQPLKRRRSRRCQADNQSSSPEKVSTGNKASSEATLSVLPDEVLLMIFSYLPMKDKFSICKTSKRFQSISNDGNLWKVLDFSQLKESASDKWLLCLLSRFKNHVEVLDVSSCINLTQASLTHYHFPNLKEFRFSEPCPYHIVWNIIGTVCRRHSRLEVLHGPGLNPHFSDFGDSTRLRKLVCKAPILRRLDYRVAAKLIRSLNLLSNLEHLELENVAISPISENTQLFTDKKMDLKSLRLSRVDTWPLFDHLDGKNLKSLTLSGSTIGIHGVYKMMSFEQLESVTISEVKNDTVGIDDVVDALQNCTSLTSFSYYGKITRDSCIRLANDHSDMQALSLRNRSAYRGPLEKDILIHFVQSMPNLKSLELEFRSLSDEMLGVISKNLLLLEELCIHGYQYCITDVGLTELLQSALKLTCLSIHDCKKVKGSVVGDLTCNLKRLKFVSSGITDDGLRSLTRACINLEHIEIANCDKLTCSGPSHISTTCQKVKTATYKLSEKQMTFATLSEANLHAIIQDHKKKLPDIRSITVQIGNRSELSVHWSKY